MKKTTLLLSFFLLCSCANNTQNTEKLNSAAPPVSSSFEFSVLDAGQADAIILQSQNHNIIIDCGEKGDGKDILKYLEEKNIDTIDYLFITHFDKDHVGGAPDVLNTVNVEHIITPDYTGSGNAYKNYLNAVEAGGYTPQTIKEDMSVTLDDVLFNIYVPEKSSYSEGDNDFSLVISVYHGDNTFLFAGDAEKERLSELTFLSEHDFLKVPHHGRFNVMTKNFISNIKPKYSVITCSEKNPAEDTVVELLENAGSEVYFTKDGRVDILSDGKNIKINQSF